MDKLPDQNLYDDPAPARPSKPKASADAKLYARAAIIIALIGCITYVLTHRYQPGGRFGGTMPMTLDNWTGKQSIKFDPKTDKSYTITTP